MRRSPRSCRGLLGYTINSAGLDEVSNDLAMAGTDYLEFADWDAAVTAYNSEEWEAARAHPEAIGAETIRTWLQDTK